MKSQHAARSYAKALFELAKERGQRDTVLRELGTMVELLTADASLQQFLARPGVSAAAKRAVAEEIARRLGKTPHQTRALAHKALEKLRTLLRRPPVGPRRGNIQP